MYCFSTPLDSIPQTVACSGITTPPQRQYHRVFVLYLPQKTVHTLLVADELISCLHQLRVFVFQAILQLPHVRIRLWLDRSEIVNCGIFRCESIVQVDHLEQWWQGPWSILHVYPNQLKNKQSRRHNSLTYSNLPTWSEKRNLPSQGPHHSRQKWHPSAIHLCF